MLSLSISKLLKQCLYGFLSDQSQTPTAIQYLLCQLKPFQEIPRMLLQLLNIFLKETERNGLRSDIRLYFSNEETGDRLAGYFIEAGVLGMLKAKSIDYIDFVSQFSDEIVDVCCGYSSSAPLPDVFTKYVNILSSMNRQNCHPVCTEPELVQL